MQISFVMLIFLLIWAKFFLGGKLLEGGRPCEGKPHIGKGPLLTLEASTQQTETKVDLYETMGNS